jgi:hypothetical protein
MANSIHELLLKIPAPLQLSMSCYAELPVIVSFKDTIYNLQMTYYWLIEADKYFKQINSGEEILTEGTLEPTTIVIPGGQSIFNR